MTIRFGSDTMGWLPPPPPPDPYGAYGAPPPPRYGAPPPPRYAARSLWDRLRGRPPAPYEQPYADVVYGQGQPRAPYGGAPRAPYGGAPRAPAPPSMNSWERWKQFHPGTPYQNYLDWWQQYGAAGATISGDPDEE